MVKEFFNSDMFLPVLACLAVIGIMFMLKHMFGFNIIISRFIMLPILLLPGMTAFSLYVIKDEYFYNMFLGMVVLATPLFFLAYALYKKDEIKAKEEKKSNNNKKNKKS